MNDKIIIKTEYVNSRWEATAPSLAESLTYLLPPSLWRLVGPQKWGSLLLHSTTIRLQRKISPYSPLLSLFSLYHLNSSPSRHDRRATDTLECCVCMQSRSWVHVGTGLGANRYTNEGPTGPSGGDGYEMLVDAPPQKYKLKLKSGGLSNECLSVQCILYTDNNF